MITVHGTPQSSSSLTGNGDIITAPATSWTRGDVVCLAVQGDNGPLVSSNPITNTGNGLGNWQRASGILTNSILDTELWFCVASQDGGGTITARWASGPSNSQVVAFVLSGASASNFIDVHNEAGGNGDVNPASVTSNVDATQGLLIYGNQSNVGGVPTAPTGFALVLNSSDHNLTVCLQSATNLNGATVTPGIPGNEAQPGPSIPSNALTLLLNTNGTAPGAVTTGATTQDTATVTMPSKPVGATSLSLIRSTNATGPYATILTGLNGNQAVVDNNNGTLLNGATTYYYAAVAVYPTSQPFGISESATTLNYYAPGEVGFDRLGQTQTELAIIMPSDPYSADSLTLQYSLDPLGPYTVVAAGLLGNERYVHSGLTAGTTYYYEAVAVYGHGSTAGVFNSARTSDTIFDFEESPYTRWTSVGVQAASLYPYGGPYDDTTIEMLEGIEFVDFSTNVSLSEGFGGESPLLIFSAETKRTIDLKASAFKISLRLAQLLLGGNLAVDGLGQLDEKQYWTATYTGRAQYFRLVCVSTNGDGTAQLVFPKVKCAGSLTWNMKAEAINVVEFNAKPQYDSTYICQNGQVGAIFDWFFGYGPNNILPVS